MQQFDVLVVGAGLAGLRCAALLARRDVSVLLVDRKIRPDQAVHTTGIFVRRTLDDFEFPDGCLGPAIRHVHLYSPSGRKLTLVSPQAEFAVGKMGRLYCSLLKDAMQSGTVWRGGTSFVGSQPSGTASIVSLDRAGQTDQVKVRYIVGADGAKSRVASDLGLSENREWIVGVEDVLEGVPSNGPPQVHCYLDPRLAPGYIAWVAHDGEEVHLGVGGYPQGYQPLSALETFRQRVASLYDWSQSKLVERRGGLIPVGGVLRKIVGPNGLLVGDAAGAVSPLTAGGLDPCMRLAALAAQVIEMYLQTGNPAMLAPYDGNRFRRKFAARLQMRRLLAAARLPIVNELMFAALSVWPFRLVVDRVFFGRGSFPIEREDLVLHVADVSETAKS